MPGLLYVLYALLNTAAIVLIKEARSAFVASRHGTALARFAIAGAVYAGALATLVAVLRQSDANVVLPIAIGCTVVATNAAGAGLYGERMTPRKAIGLMLVLGGIALTYVQSGAS